MKKSKLNWRDYYHLPLRADKCTSHVWTDNDIMAFQFLQENKYLREYIVSVVNGVAFYPIEDVKIGEGVIYIGGQEALLLRGWGYLTGTGGFNLPEEDAIEVQDGFANYIKDRLNGITQGI